MPEAPFYERFRALLARLNLRPEEAASIMETGVDSVRRLADGRTKQMKLDEALRLCDRFGLDPWELAFGKPRASSPPGQSPDRLEALEERVDLLTRQLARMAASSAAAAEQVERELEAGAQRPGKRRHGT